MNNFLRRFNEPDSGDESEEFRGFDDAPPLNRPCDDVDTVPGVDVIDATSSDRPCDDFGPVASIDYIPDPILAARRLAALHAAMAKRANDDEDNVIVTF